MLREEEILLLLTLLILNISNNLEPAVQDRNTAGALLRPYVELKTQHLFLPLQIKVPVNGWAHLHVFLPFSKQETTSVTYCLPPRKIKHSQDRVI